MARITLLDGGLGQEINKRSPGETHPLWSLTVMFHMPDVVVDVHSEFIAAGARVICLNTYTATPTRMERDGFGERFEEAHATAARLAAAALERSGLEAGAVQIAGCLPPLVASYKSDVAKSYHESLAEFRRIVNQQKDRVDVFQIETMSNIDEASAALDAAGESGKPVYVGLTLSDDSSNTLRSGERLEDAVGVLMSRNPDGILLNCSIPEAITAAMPVLAGLIGTDVRFGAYANGFTSIDRLQPGGTVDVLEAREDLTPEAYARHVMRWTECGATIVGGCCEVGPNHIRHLARTLKAAGHEIANFG